MRLNLELELQLESESESECVTWDSLHTIAKYAALFLTLNAQAVVVAVFAVVQGIVRHLALT